MSRLLINDVISRIRTIIKADRQESFLTDRAIYSLFRKHASLVMKRLDERGKLNKFDSVFETLDYVELEECDKVEACCTVKSYSTFRKTVLPMPMFTEGSKGPMVRSITSLDGATSIQLIDNIDLFNYISRSKNFKYNKTKYGWYINDRIYFGNIDWPAVRVEGIFEEDISVFKCDEEKCFPRQQQSLNVPDFLLSEIESSVLRDLGFRLQIPTDTNSDNININR